MSTELLLNVQPEFVHGVLTFLSVAALGMAYSDVSRKVIFRRADGYCEQEDCSMKKPVAGSVHRNHFPNTLFRPAHASDGIGMQAAHLDHRKKHASERTVPYDSPEGGLLLCPEDHFSQDAWILSNYLYQDIRELSPGDREEMNNLRYGLLMLATHEIQHGHLSYAHNPNYFEERGMVAQYIVAKREHNPDIQTRFHPWIENMIAWVVDTEIEQGTLVNQLAVCKKLTGLGDFNALQSFIADLEQYEIDHSSPTLSRGALMWNSLWNVLPFNESPNFERVKNVYASFPSYTEYPREKPAVRFLLYLDSLYQAELTATTREPAFNASAHARLALKLGLDSVIESLPPQSADYAKEITAEYQKMREEEEALARDRKRERVPTHAPIPGLPGRWHDDDFPPGVSDEELDRIARTVALREGFV